MQRIADAIVQESLRVQDTLKENYQIILVPQIVLRERNQGERNRDRYLVHLVRLDRIRVLWDRICIYKI